MAVLGLIGQRLLTSPNAEVAPPELLVRIGEFLVAVLCDGGSMTSASHAGSPPLPRIVEALEFDDEPDAELEREDVLIDGGAVGDGDRNSDSDDDDEEEEEEEEEASLAQQDAQLGAKVRTNAAFGLLRLCSAAGHHSVVAARPPLQEWPEGSASGGSKSDQPVEPVVEIIGGMVSEALRRLAYTCSNQPQEQEEDGDDVASAVATARAPFAAHMLLLERLRGVHWPWRVEEEEEEEQDKNGNEEAGRIWPGPLFEAL